LHLKLFFSILIVAILNLIIAMLFFKAGMKKIKDEDEES
jgi:cell division protein FtsL